MKQKALERYCSLSSYVCVTELKIALIFLANCFLDIIRTNPMNREGIVTAETFLCSQLQGSCLRNLVAVEKRSTVLHDSTG